MVDASVVLILGAGPRIGASVAAAFASKGYKVAIASRKGKNTINDDGHLSLFADLSKPDSIPALFDDVRNEFKASPSVVIYNAAALTPPPDNGPALSIPVESVVSDLNVNTISPYVAAQHAVKGWQGLPNEIKKTFIFTGNILNNQIMPVPMFLNLGVGKSASAFWIGIADATYTGEGFRFFYADERKADGSSKGLDVDGPAHGEFYTALASHDGKVPWQATFVAGKGYVKFD